LGAAVLLLREGLVGTLSGAAIESRDRVYQVVFEVGGEVDKDMLVLALNCAEARQRWLDPDQAPDAAPDASETPIGAGSDESFEDSPWMSLDCAGWDLELTCGLAGDCATGDCNMVCDITYFGDAYAHSEIVLADVEDEFDYWQRV
jgi:hypothetical protein